MASSIRYCELSARGQDEKGAMAGTRVEPRRQTMARSLLDLSAAAGLAAGERQKDDQGRQEDRKTDGMGGSGRGGTGRDVPSRRFSPSTLLSYKWRSGAGDPLFAQM